MGKFGNFYVGKADYTKLLNENVGGVNRHYVSGDSAYWFFDDFSIVAKRISDNIISVCIQTIPPEKTGDDGFLELSKDAKISWKKIQSCLNKHLDKFILSYDNEKDIEEIINTTGLPLSVLIREKTKHDTGITDDTLGKLQEIFNKAVRRAINA